MDKKNLDKYSKLDYSKYKNKINLLMQNPELKKLGIKKEIIGKTE